MSKKLIIEYGGRVDWKKEPEVIGYEVSSIDTLLKTIEFIKGDRFKMNVKDRFFHVYEFGPLVQDDTSLRLLKEREEKEERRKYYLKLKQEFDGA